MKRRKFGFIGREKKILLLILVTFFFLTQYISARSQSSLKYYLAIDEQKWDSFDITVTVNNNKFENLLCALPTLDPWLQNYDSPGIQVSEINVSDIYGNNLSFQQLKSNAWLIDAKDKNTIIISYKIKNPGDHVLGTCLNKQHARVDCGSVFIYVRELVASRIHLAVRVPNGWKLATGLAQAGRIFEYDVKNYQELMNHALYMAPFEEIYFKVQDRTGFIIIDGKQTPHLTKMLTIPTKVAPHLLKLFQDIPFDQYLVILKIFPDPRPICSRAYENTSIVYLSNQALSHNFFDVTREVASNFFQIWNGNRFYPVARKWEAKQRTICSSSLWFQYGVSDYYACLMLVRSGVWSQQEFFNYHVNLINQLYRHYDKNLHSVATLSSQIVKYDAAKVMPFIRIKGQLLGLLLDLKIRSATNNRRSLDDMMFFMNKWFGKKHIGYRDEDILRSICAVTGVDVTSFFDLYVNGTIELPFTEALASAGVSLESRIDTVADLGEIVISPQENIVNYVDKKGPLGNSGLKIGDKIASLDNQTIYYPGQFMEIADSLKIDQEVELSIRREGFPLMLLTKAQGKPCRVISIKSLEPQSEQQQQFREFWLGKHIAKQTTGSSHEQK